MPAYAESSDVVLRFDAEKDRNHWVSMADLMRARVPEDADRVQRLETLSEHGAIRWRPVQDPDARVTYMMPDRVLPQLPAGEAYAYWLCDHEDGPRLSQPDAADVLDTTQGSLSNQLRRARDKLEG